MQKILVVGSAGARKSTLSRHLARILDLNLIHLDALSWKSGWVESDQAEWQAQLHSALCRESSIIDGNYSKTLPQRLRVPALDLKLSDQSSTESAVLARVASSAQARGAPDHRLGYLLGAMAFLGGGGAGTCRRAR